MKKLSPLAKQLVEVGRTAQRPSDADKHRIHQALQQRLFASPQAQPPAEPGVAPKPAPPPSAPWPLISAVTVGAGILAGALYWGLSSEPAPAPPTAPTLAPAAQPSPAASTDSVTPAPTAAEQETATAAPAPLEKKPMAPKGKAGNEAQPKRQLAEEVALLSRATSALNAGRAQEALGTLAEHQRKFPRGLLSVERRAARAQALCMLGRKAEAERELSRLSPSSPQAARARQLCGGK